MIVNEEGGKQTRSDKPNENWMGEGWFAVPDGSDLAKKIEKNYPFYDLVIEGDILVDIDLWDQERIDEYKEERQQDEPPTTEEKINQLQADLDTAIIELSTVIAMQGGTADVYKK
jgi:hypothetical protein